MREKILGAKKLAPLVLAAIGVSGASFFAPIARYRLVFIGITFALIGVSYYFTYRRKKPCCPSESIDRRWTQEVPLWVITAIAVGLVVYTYTNEFVGRPDSSNPSECCKVPKTSLQGAEESGLR